MNIKKIFTSLIVFALVWYMLNLLPIIPVQYEVDSELTSSSPNWCSLNYVLSCFNSVDDFGITYPTFLRSGIVFYLMIIILPILFTILIMSLISRYTSYFGTNKY